MHLTVDQQWTRFVRMWRDLASEHHRIWLDSPQRIRTLVAAHPLPWTIDRDWTWEVLAADGTCVAKKMTYEAAAAFVATAQAL